MHVNHSVSITQSTIVSDISSYLEILGLTITNQTEFYNIIKMHVSYQDNYAKK
jgi:hypothetical protein